ncbi:MAG TPA: Ig-like domain-containing protein, partial [Bacteroidota bacterium]|nr:Ig-like domain-containing protein [Bacteroidota bacterium]
MRNYLPAVLLLVCSIIAFHCKGSDGPVGPAGESYESLTDPAVKPLVMTTYPSNKSVGPYLDYTNRVTIWFNKIMDRTSMKHALHLTSSLGDVQLDTTSVSVQNTNAFTIAPLDARGSSYKFLWKINQQYSLTVDSGAVDVNGNVLGSAFTMTFTPEPYFRVISMAPVAGTTEVGTTSTITLTLNSPVDSSFFSFIHISPALTGQWIYTPGFPGPDSTVIKYSFKNAMNDSEYT